ncbi:hypothetical protein TNCV_2892451 [Trichonephila clavipes]|nr:hypothetical protein TNCV_2892451 [Trichonephila clavipes]
MTSRRVHYEKKMTSYPEKNGYTTLAGKFDTDETNIHRWRKERVIFFFLYSSTKSFIKPKIPLNVAKYDIVWKNDDASDSSEVSCNTGTDESFLEYDIEG